MKKKSAGHALAWLALLSDVASGVVGMADVAGIIIIGVVEKLIF